MYVFDGLDHGVGHLAYRRPSEKAAPRHQCGLKCVVKAVSGALATKQRAAAKAALQAQETLQQVQEQLQLQQTRDEPAKRGPGPPPKATISVEQAAQGVQAARAAHQRIS